MASLVLFGPPTLSPIPQPFLCVRLFVVCSGTDCRERTLLVNKMISVVIGVDDEDDDDWGDSCCCQMFHKYVYTTIIEYCSTGMRLE